MRAVGTVLLALGLGLRAAAGAEDLAPTLPPLPATTPLPPSVEAVHRDDDSELLQRIDRLIQDREGRIAALVKEGAGPDPVAGKTPRIETEDPATIATLKAHAEARSELRKALDAAARRNAQGNRDVLDRGRPRAQAAQAGPLTAQNQLAIAECWKDLAGSPDGGLADLESGIAAIAATDTAKLPDAERPRMLYLALWFQLETARRLPADAPAAERAKRVATARERQAELASQFPDSALTRTAEALFAGVETTPTGKP